MTHDEHHPQPSPASLHAARRTDPPPATEPDERLSMRSDHTAPHWTADPNHPKWDAPVGYSHAANILELLSQNA